MVLSTLAEWTCFTGGKDQEIPVSIEALRPGGVAQKLAKNNIIIIASELIHENLSAI